MAKPRPDDLLSVAAAAAIIGLDESQVRRHIKRGHLPYVEISERIRLVRRADAVAFRKVERKPGRKAAGK